MAKRRLTDDAINYIIKCRDASSKTYTWQEISDLVKDNFNIDVSLQAVSQAYRKHKNSFKPPVEIENQPNKAQISRQPKQESIIKTKRSFNDEVNQDDLNDIMSQLEE